METNAETFQNIFFFWVPYSYTGLAWCEGVNDWIIHLNSSTSTISSVDHPHQLSFAGEYSSNADQPC